MKKRITFTLEEDLILRLKAVSEETMIPQSKLVEKSIKEVLKVHESKTEYSYKKEQSE